MTKPTNEEQYAQRALTLEIVDMGAKEKVYEGISQTKVEKGDVIVAGEHGNKSDKTVIVFVIKRFSNFYWWYGTEHIEDEPDDPCDSDFMEEISS